MSNSLLVLIVLVVVAFLVVCLVFGSSRRPRKVWIDNIERSTLENDNWRKVVHTADGMQVVLMSTPPGASLGMEVHPHTDQFFRFESGKGAVEIKDSDGNVTSTPISDGSAIVIPRGTHHNIINTSSTDPLKSYTIYTPPHHPPDTIHRTQADELRH